MLPEALVFAVVIGFWLIAVVAGAMRMLVSRASTQLAYSVAGDLSP